MASDPKYLVGWMSEAFYLTFTGRTNSYLLTKLAFNLPYFLFAANTLSKNGRITPQFYIYPTYAHGTVIHKPFCVSNALSGCSKEVVSLAVLERFVLESYCVCCLAFQCKEDGKDKCLVEIVKFLEDEIYEFNKWEKIFTHTLLDFSSSNFSMLPSFDHSNIFLLCSIDPDASISMFTVSTVNGSASVLDAPVLDIENVDKESVLFIDSIKDKNLRITALCCNSGRLQLNIVNSSNKQESSYYIYWDGPLTRVQLFHSANDLRLLVCGAIEPAAIYYNVLKGLSNAKILLESQETDCIVCSTVFDIDFDGECEILLGSYSGELLVYKEQPKIGYLLYFKRKFSSPLYSLYPVDITGDGLYELLVFTRDSIHIMQHDVDEVLKIFKERLCSITA